MRDSEYADLVGPTLTLLGRGRGVVVDPKPATAAHHARVAAIAGAAMGVIEAALDQPDPTPALKIALEAYTRATLHPDRRRTRAEKGEG
jgi:hypothetical protein